MFKKFIVFQKDRINRIRLMNRDVILGKIMEKLFFYFNYRNIVRRVAYRLDRYSTSHFTDIYKEREESGAVNIELKHERVRGGGRFEPLDVELVNHGAATFIGDAKNILEIGSGTGMFASYAAMDKSRQITASESNQGALEWAKENRFSDNINFCSLQLDDVNVDEYDLVVSLEVVEHLGNYGKFLLQLSKVAPRAIISSPNKDRSAFDSVTSTPFYLDHVREWTAGEFYWVLKTFYKEVELYTFEDTKKSMVELRNCEDGNNNFGPLLKPCSLWAKDHHIFACCSKPRREFQTTTL